MRVFHKNFYLEKGLKAINGGEHIWKRNLGLKPAFAMHWCVALYNFISPWFLYNEANNRLGHLCTWSPVMREYMWKCLVDNDLSIASVDEVWPGHSPPHCSQAGLLAVFCYTARSFFHTGSTILVWYPFLWVSIQLVGTWLSGITKNPTILFWKVIDTSVLKYFSDNFHIQSLILFSQPHRWQNPGYQMVYD